MVTPVERFMLFVLGEFFTQASKRLDKAPLEISISKAEFISIVLKANMATKKARALYKNLESLEFKGLIAYAGKNLRLTNKGQKTVGHIHSDLVPYFCVNDIIKSENTLKYARRAQTIFSQK